MKIKYPSPFSPHFTFHTFCEDTDYRQLPRQQGVFETIDNLT